MLQVGRHVRKRVLGDGGLGPAQRAAANENVPGKVKCTFAALGLGASNGLLECGGRFGFGGNVVAISLVGSDDGDGLLLHTGGMTSDR